MRFRLLLLVVLLARPAAAQVPDTTSGAPGTIVSGVVLDSISGAPLVGAIVQLVAADNIAGLVRTDTSDALGWFMFGDVGRGRYLLGFLHPLLDSLGVEAPLREVHVVGRLPLRTDLAIPSPWRLHAAICGEQSARDSAAVVVGVVRNALDLAPAPDVAVTGEWLEFSVSREGFTRRTRRVVATTTATGWFALCGVPSPGTTAIIASHGADSTGVVEIAVSAEPFVRRDLYIYIGATRTVTLAESTRPADASGVQPPRSRAGEGRVDGTVIAAARGTPLAGAQVKITGGPETRANDRGEWTLIDVPSGTQALEVRALGYYPERRPVHVVEGAPPVHVALSTLDAVLDTVRVTATRGDRYQSGFAERRRMGIGTYLDAEDIARRAPTVASDILRSVAGIRMEIGTIMMRSSALGDCSPVLYINGRYVPAMGPVLEIEDIDAWVRPHELAGVEVYFDAVPPQFQQTHSGCGSIVIWTK